MKDTLLHFFIRNIEAGDLLENFLISAIASILIIRTFLHFTGYPALGNGPFHIAHMIWGGLLMMIALFLLLSYLNREVKNIAAIIGGIGFGTFLDELGKFITRDNNYFFRPTIAIIYVVFIILFFAFRALDQYAKMSKKEYAINALEFMKDALVHDLDREEKKQAMKLLRKSDQNDPLVQLLKQMFKDIDALPPPKENLLVRIKIVLEQYYRKIIEDPWFAKIVVWFFIIVSSVNFVRALISLRNVSSIAEWGQLLSTILSGILVLIGTYCIIRRKDRLSAYQFFRHSILASLLLTQFFLFYRNQLLAISGLFANLIIFSLVQYLLYQENMLEKEEKGKMIAA